MHPVPTLQSTINTPMQPSPIGKKLDYDGSEHQTINNGKKKLIIFTNYGNININSVTFNYYTFLLQQNFYHLYYHKNHQQENHLVVLEQKPKKTMKVRIFNINNHINTYNIHNT